MARRPASPVRSRMRMRDLERATGVGRETIRFYIREGLLPEPARPSARQEGRRRFDLIGAGLFIATLTMFLLALNMAQRAEIEPALGLGLISVAALAAFIFREQRFTDPLIRLDPEDRLPLRNHHAVPLLHQVLGQRPREGRQDLVEHLHHLDDEERLARLEMVAHIDERRQVRRFACVERAAGGRDDFVGTRLRGRRQGPSELSRARRVAELIRKYRFERFAHLDFGETRLEGDARDQQQELESELKSTVRGHTGLPEFGVAAGNGVGTRTFE